jgi:pimeloyl-ACP methyl ester carboxylesterase
MLATAFPEHYGLAVARPLPHLAGVEHRYVELPELRVHVAEAGKGEPVVLLHGWPQNWWSWRRLIPLLADRFRMLCPDLRGAGWSDAPAAGYDKETMAVDLLALLDRLELDRVRLIGHDVGGFVGFLACLRAPERVSHYLALNTGHPFVPPIPSVLASFWRFWYWPLLGAPVLGPWLIRHRAFPVLLRRWFTADRAAWSSADTAVFSGLVEERARAIASSKTYRSYLVKDSPRTLGGRYRATYLSVPTLMLHGADDRILREPFLRGYERYADDMTLEQVPGVGHFIAEERPRLVAERAFEFFAR